MIVAVTKFQRGDTVWHRPRRNQLRSDVWEPKATIYLANGNGTYLIRYESRAGVHLAQEADLEKRP